MVTKFALLLIDKVCILERGKNNRKSLEAKGMMESSQSVLSLAIPETDNPDETIPDAEEPNNGLSEEGKNEMNEQQESGIIDQVTEEEDLVKTLSSIQEEEPSLIPDTKTSISSGMKETLVSSRKQSCRSSNSQRSQLSVGHQSLPSPMPLQGPMQLSVDVGTKGSVAWLNQRTGKEMKCKFNQTSFIWEIKPLAEILQPSSKTPQISKDTDKDETEARETVFPVQDTETEQNAMQESAQSMQPLEGTDGQDFSPCPLPVEQESEHGQQPEEQASQHDSEHTLVSQPPQDIKPAQVQPPNDAMMEGDIKLISKKTGKQMKSSFNQTSCIWERKPLAEILHPPSAETPSPEKYTASPEVGEIKQATVEEVLPSTPQVEEQELQHGSQQLEALESKQDDGQEAATEAQEAPEEAPEALEEAPEAPEKAPEAPEEAPDKVPEQFDY
ncbi:UNVERIFIED_CONTAM: hypothetical protein K2H54_032033 [Gekko kuhli]